MSNYQEYRFQFSCLNMWQGNRVKALICEQFPQMPADDVFVENWTGAIDPPSVLVVVNIGTTSKEDWQRIQADMEAIALKASKHVELCSWPYCCRGWDWVPPPEPEKGMKLKTLDIRTAHGELIAQLNINSLDNILRVRVNRTVFGDGESDRLIILGDGESIDGFDIAVSKWG